MDILDKVKVSAHGNQSARVLATQGQSLWMLKPGNFPPQNPMGEPHKKHTPIVTKKQSRFFGAEYGRAKAGKSRKTEMSKAILKSHLKEWGKKRKRGV